MDGPAPPPNRRRQARNLRPDRARSPVGAARGRSSVTHPNSPGGSHSSASSGITSDGRSGGGQAAAEVVSPPAMLLRGCPRCFMYVMVQVHRQRCPQCKTAALVRLFDA